MPKQDEAAAVWVDVDSLTPWDKNPREIGPRAIKDVAASIKRFGFASPVIARTADSVVIAGHTRLLAAKKLGMDRVPVRFMDLDPGDAALLAIADNRVAEHSEWSDDLDDLLRTLAEDGLDITDAGFTSDELADRLIAEATTSLDEGEDHSDDYDENLTYSVVIECVDEDEQAALLERFEGEGLSAKPLVS